jgi:outer membrane protein OmpA-like peptidoglycan-associated protein
MLRCRIRVCVGWSLLACAVIVSGDAAQAAERPVSMQARMATEDAQRQLAYAREDLARGDTHEGRRRLEVLVARYPETAAAEEARRELGRLYSGAPSRAVTDRSGPSLALSPPDPRGDPPASSGPASRFGAALPAARSGEVQSPRSDSRFLHALAQDFQLNVGDRVFFGEASADLGSHARSLLAQQAQWLSKYSAIAVVVEGHADDRGSNDYNRDLALRRALAVRARLIEEGVEPERVTVNSLGRGQPVAACSHAECAAHNRRAVVVLSEQLAAAVRGVSRSSERAIPEVRQRTGNARRE